MERCSLIMLSCESDVAFMREALNEARKAFELGEAPIGCVAVKEGEIIARAHNLREAENDPTAHAEILALRSAGKAIGSRSLDGITLYVTLEPCPMCMSAIMLAHVGRLVYGSDDPKIGAVVSRWNLAHDPALKHSIKVSSGVLAEECRAVLNDFFGRSR